MLPVSSVAGKKIPDCEKYRVPNIMALSPMVKGRMIMASTM
jgi:hypothetical protein